MAIEERQINTGSAYLGKESFGQVAPNSSISLTKETIGSGLPQVRDILTKSPNSSSSPNLPKPDNKYNPKNLFYNAGMYSPDAAKFNTFLFNAFDGASPGSDVYYRSENRSYNKRVSSTRSKNPSAGNLVGKSDYSRKTSSPSDIIGGESAPYFWKDFLYCKYYGTIPNNRLITLRRFPHPMPDNLNGPNEAYASKGGARPVAQAVTWFGGNTGNQLDSLISFGTGIEWQTVSQEDKITVPTLDGGLFGAASGILA
jgi:hypothetical protein